jgi:upstream activation factor subunit UAF30
MPRGNPTNMKPVLPDAALAAVIGTTAPTQRSQIVKLVWVYIKAHGCQDATNRRQINADDTLRPLFDGKASVSMFDLAKCISRHVATPA